MTDLKIRSIVLSILSLTTIIGVPTNCTIQEKERFSTRALDPRFLVEWTANIEPDLQGYKIYWGTESRKYSDTSTVYRPSTSLVIENVMTDCTYYFAVTAFDTARNESSYSMEVFNRIYTEVPPDTTAPSPPGGVSCTALK